VEEGLIKREDKDAEETMPKVRRDVDVDAPDVVGVGVVEADNDAVYASR